MWETKTINSGFGAGASAPSAFLKERSDAFDIALIIKKKGLYFGILAIARMNLFNQFGKLLDAGIAFSMLREARSGALAPRWKVYPMYIESEDRLVSKTYMTRVEEENTRLRHYLARLHRKTLCYSKSLLFQFDLKDYNILIVDDNIDKHN